MLKIRLYYIFFFCIWVTGYCQDFGQIGKAKLFKLTGGISGSTIFYEGDSNRESLSYFINGNLNLNISGIYSIPVTFSYSNQKFQVSNPISFNRLSMHPSYKWVTAHIGDVSMTFSPYTLNGHQFTGLGVELTHEGPFKLSMMFGRLLKASEYDPGKTESQPAFKRLGYGVNASYDFDDFSLGVIFFKATDDKESIKNPVPVTQELTPKENVVLSVQGKAKIFDKGEIRLEAASSTITEDINATGKEERPFLGSLLLKNNSTTQHFKAYNLNFSYPLAKGMVGIGYEYIDPEYRTLGAYFFNNDLENITLNASQTIFNDKVNIAFNAGLQRDDLDNTKSSQLQRIVSSVTLGYNASEKLNITAGYSNFQSYTNIKNQFDYINEVSQFQNVDTLNFQQISKNANLNVNYILKNTETETQNFNIGLSFQNALNKQDGKTIENGNSNFYNGNTSYTLGFTKKDLNISIAGNVSYSSIGVDNTLTFGPMVSINKKYFNKRLRITGSCSYNQSKNNGIKQGDIINIRVGSTYTYLKKHNLNLNLLSQFRNSTTANNDFTITFSYNYTFDKFKPQLKIRKKSKKVKVKRKSKGNEIIEFTYRDSLYRGTMDKIDEKLSYLYNHDHFNYIPAYKKKELNVLRLEVADERKAEDYKPKAINFLKELYSYEDFLKGYNQLIFEVLSELRKDMLRLDYAFEKGFVSSRAEVNSHILHKKTPKVRQTYSKVLRDQYKKLQQTSENNLARLIAHRWALPIIQSYTTIDKVENPDEYLKEIMEIEKDAIFRFIDKQEKDQKVKLYMLERIIDFYINKSLKYTNPNKFDLKYIDNKKI